MLFIVEKGQWEKNLHISRQAQIQYILEWFSSNSLTFLVSIKPFSFFFILFMYVDFFHGVFGSPCFLVMVVNVFATVGIGKDLFANIC